MRPRLVFCLADFCGLWLALFLDFSSAFGGFSIIEHRKKLCRKWMCFCSAFEMNLHGYVSGLGINQRKRLGYRKSGVGSKLKSKNRFCYKKNCSIRCCIRSESRGRVSLSKVVIKCSDG